MVTSAFLTACSDDIERGLQIKQYQHHFILSVHSHEVICQYNRGCLCAMTWPKVKLGGVICRGQVLQEFVCSRIHLNLAQQLKAWKMKQYLASALVTQPAVRHRDPSSLDQTATT